MRSDEESGPPPSGEAGASSPRDEAGASAPLEFIVEEESAGARVDAALAELARVSRSQVQRWIEADRVRVAGEPVRASRRLAVGEAIAAWPIQPVETHLRPEALPLVVLYEDEDLVVVDKAAGMVVHPAPGHPSGTLVNALLHHCGDLAGIGGVLRPGIVHRLDRGTSGVLVVAKNDAAHRALAAQFAAHTILRVYRTFVRGLPGAASGRIDRPIGRHPRDRKRMSVESRTGRPSATRWRVVRRFPGAGVSELEVRPETGRTHQIRVHLAAAGLPLVGDRVYGRARGPQARLGRPALHAEQLGFEHPRSGEWLELRAPLPEDLMRLVERLGPAESEPSAGGGGEPSAGGGGEPSALEEEPSAMVEEEPSAGAGEPSAGARQPSAARDRSE
jgi:23S rRNA pseudouridine1911/1915/1917 synthase